MNMESFCESHHPSSTIIAQNSTTESQNYPRAHLAPMTHGDRFIPARMSPDATITFFQLQEDLPKEDASRLMQFSFKGKNINESSNGSLISKALTNSSIAKSLSFENRPVPKPYSLLDAPQLTDDFYLNPIDWSPSNVLAVSLSPQVFLRSEETKKIERVSLASFPFGDPTSLKFSSENILAIGFTNGDLGLWDCVKGVNLRKLTRHSDRVSALSWSPSHPKVLSTSSKDASIIQHDTRSQLDMFMNHTGHVAEVSGLSWSPCGTWLASGGNDNLLCLWNMNSALPLSAKNDHKGW